MPAIVQLASFLIDMAMPLEQAFATPRVDVSPGRIVCDARLPEDVPRALVRLKPATVAEQRVTTEPFTLPTGVTRNLAAGLNSGVAHIFSPTAGAVSEERDDAEPEVLLRALNWGIKGVYYLPQCACIVAQRRRLSVERLCLWCWH